MRTEINKLHMTVYGSRAFIPTAKYLHSLSLPLSFRVPKGGGGGIGRSPGADQALWGALPGSGKHSGIIFFPARPPQNLESFLSG